MQREWDKPLIAADISKLNASLPVIHHQARLLAISTPHRGDWLHALLFHHVLCVWITKLPELPWDYVLEPSLHATVFGVL